MKNSFFVLLSFAFFLISCTKDFVEPIAENLTSTESVSNRTETIGISGTVANSSIIIEDIDVHMIDLNDDPSGFTPTLNQVLQFQNTEGEIVNVPALVTSFNIIIEDIDVHLVVPVGSLTGLTLVGVQTLDFI